MQRLFSNFPNGWPGGGLLVLRLVASAFLLTQSAAKFLPATQSDGMTPAVVGVVAGLLMLIGLWTPVGCLLAAAAESWFLLQAGVAPQAAILLISICVALAMLGPGSWSIDSVLYGRHRLDISE